MRAAFAQVIAFGTGLLVVAAVLLFAALQGRGYARAVAPEAPVPIALAADDPAPLVPEVLPEPAMPDTLVQLGMSVYQDRRCASCHSIAGVGSPRNPLDGVGSRLARDQIRLWIVDPQAMRPGIRKPSYSDLSEEQLAGLIAYMESLTAPRR
jgi:mono/diheme cytochrome c family protein